MVQSSTQSRRRLSHPAIAFGLAICAIFLLLLATSASADDSSDTPDAPGSIAGTVTNDAGEPLAGIQVLLYRNSTAIRNSVLTDAAGRYELRVLGAGIYQLRFYDPTGTYARQYYDGVNMLQEATDILITGQDVSGIDAVLTGGARITGTVSTSGLGSGYTRIYLWRERGGQYNPIDVTYLSSDPIDNPAPEYSFIGLDAGNYAVCAYATAYYTMPNNSRGGRDISECYDDFAISSVFDYNPPDNLNDADIIDLKPSETISNINLVLGQGGDRATLAGAIIGSDGAPIAYARIGLYPESAPRRQAFGSVSDINGVYVVSGIVPGAYYIRFSDPAGEYLSLCLNELDNCEAPGREDLEGLALYELAPNETRTGVDGTLKVPARLNGKITINDRQPPEGMSVAISARDAVESNSSDRHGHDIYDAVTGVYTLTGLAPGAYQIWASGNLDSAYFSNPLVDETGETLTITLAEGERIGDADIDLEPDAYEGVVHGAIDNGSAPLSDMRVEVFKNYYDTNALIYTDTNSSGAYRIEGFGSGGYYFFHVSDPSGEYATVYSTSAENPYETDGRYMDPAQQMITYSLSLTRAGQIQGQIVPPFDDDSTEYRVDGYHVSWWETGGCGIFPMPERLDCLLTLPVYYRRFAGAPVAEVSAEGDYTIAGLHPGIYVVELRQRSAPDRSWQTTQFFPQAPNPYEAKLLVVTGGETVEAIDFDLNMAPRQFMPLVEQ